MTAQLRVSGESDDIPQEKTSGGCLRAFGLSLETAMQPPGAWQAWPTGQADLAIVSASPGTVAEHWSGMASIGWRATIDEQPFVLEVGRAGDHRFVHGEHSLHHLSADATVLRCAPANVADATWWRVVLDSVLFSVALLRGYEALHAGAVAVGGGAVAIAAATGGGKSTLLGELLSRGCAMLADDVVVLQSRAGTTPLAHPGPPLMTVPSAVAVAPATVIATVRDEHWIAVPASPKALPLTTLVMLDRRPGLTLGLRRARNPLALLLGALMGFPRTSERERARFELASAIATQVPLWELQADPRVSPKLLGDLLLTELAVRDDGWAQR